jgi:glycosyltransferase involved in cell wall biosynthesis
MTHKILFLSGWFPYPPNNGSKLRINHLLHGLANHYAVSLLSFVDQDETDIDLQAMHAICQTVQTVRRRPDQPSSLRARFSHFSLTPSSIINTHSVEMANLITQTISTWNPDLVIASQLGTACYRNIFTQKPAVFEEVEVGLFYDRYRFANSLLKRLRYGLTWMKHRRYLANLVQGYQACTVVSQREQRLLLKLGPSITIPEIIPNCINLPDYQEFEVNRQPNTLIFTGSFNYFPNYEGMLWFIEKVFPRILNRFPLTELTITGDCGNRAMPPSTNVSLTGYIPDVRPVIASSCISIAPILAGGGTRVKILEAMALHTPVVTTHKGAEGLEVQHGVNILIADTPEEFAFRILELLENPEKRRMLADNAYQLLQKKYEWSVVMPHFLKLVAATIRQHSSPT